MMINSLNKNFLPTILKTSPNKKKSPVKNERNAIDNSNSPMSKRRCDKSLDKPNEEQNKISSNTYSTSTSSASKPGQKSTLLTPKSSMQLIPCVINLTASSSLLKESNLMSETFNRSRQQSSSIRLEKVTSREKIKYSLSPGQEKRMCSELHLRSSHSLNPSNNKTDLQGKYQHCKSNIYNLSNTSEHLMEEQKSIDEDMGIYEDEINHTELMHESNIILGGTNLNTTTTNTNTNATGIIGINQQQHQQQQSQQQQGNIMMNSSGLITNSPNTKKKKKGFAALSEMVPINLEKEQQIFFNNNYKYNPVFEYNTMDIKQQFSKPHAKYLKIAKSILNKCIEEYGNDDVYLEKTGGRLLTKEETTYHFEQYIKELGLEEYLTLVFSENTVAPTSVIHDPSGKSRVIISLPIAYREHRIRGVLNHEIGTHFIRKFNDRNQPWFKGRKKLELKPYIIIEEGLAALNQTLDSATDIRKKPYLYNAALHYYSAYMSSLLSFEELFQDLEKYIKDPLKRWKECVRVKRGIVDTSQVGGMYKDQVYLRGALEILKNRKKIDFTLLHAGKINVKDLFRLQKLGIMKTEGLKLPLFLNDMNAYKEALNRIAAFNFVEKLK